MITLIKTIRITHRHNQRHPLVASDSGKVETEVEIDGDATSNIFGSFDVATDPIIRFSNAA